MGPMTRPNWAAAVAAFYDAIDMNVVRTTRTTTATYSPRASARNGGGHNGTGTAVTWYVEFALNGEDVTEFVLPHPGSRVASRTDTRTRFLANVEADVDETREGLLEDLHWGDAGPAAEALLTPFLPKKG